MLENLEARGQIGWFEQLSDRFESMFGMGEDAFETSTGGVRGSEELEDEGIWMDGADAESEKAGFKRGREHYNDGEYADAIAVFSDLLASDRTQERRSEAAFYLGASLFNSVQYAEALPYLRDGIRDTTADFREPALMYYSFACFFTSQYEKAIDGFIVYAEEFEDGELIPYAILMLGKSYKALGDAESAVAYFNEIRENYGNADIPMEVYSDAVNELGNL
jgi:TolA-binding protein